MIVLLYSANCHTCASTVLSSCDCQFWVLHQRPNCYLRLQEWEKKNNKYLRKMEPRFDHPIQPSEKNKKHTDTWQQKWFFNILNVRIPIFILNNASKPTWFFFLINWRNQSIGEWNILTNSSYQHNHLVFDFPVLHYFVFITEIYALLSVRDVH